MLASPTFYPSYGGAEIRFRRYLPRLKEFGVESSVFTGTAKAKKISERDKAQNWYKAQEGTRLPSESYQGIEVIRYRLPVRPAKSRLNTFHEILKREIELGVLSPQVIQFLSPFPYFCKQTLQFANQYNIATVFAYTLPKQLDKNPIKRFYKAKQMQKFFQLLDCVVASSNEVKEYLRERGVTSRVEVIANGVDIEKFRPARNDDEKERLKKKLGISNNKINLLNVGSVHPRKGTDLLLRAFTKVIEKNKDVNLYIAGPRADISDVSLQKFSSDIDNILSDSSLKQRVHFLGLIDNVDEYMRAADIFVFPSRVEGMGNVVLEAMASGLPVVITPYIGFPDVFGKSEHNYMLAEFDEQKICDCILRFLSSVTLRKQIANNALRNVQNSLPLNKSIEQYASLYKELVKYKQKSK